MADEIETCTRCRRPGGLPAWQGECWYCLRDMSRPYWHDYKRPPRGGKRSRQDAPEPGSGYYQASLFGPRPAGRTSRRRRGRSAG